MAAEELVDLLQSEYGVAPADDAFQVLLRPSLATAEPMDEPGRAAESMLSSKVWGELHERIESRFTALGWPVRNRLAIKTWAQSRYAFPGARKAWDNAANDQLRALKARGLDWPAIAEHMERPRQDCKSQYQRLTDRDATGQPSGLGASGKRVYAPWTAEEDRKLVLLVEEALRTKEGGGAASSSTALALPFSAANNPYAGLPWKAIATRLGSRTSEQCRSTWLRRLAPHVKTY